MKIELSEEDIIKCILVGLDAVLQPEVLNRVKEENIVFDMTKEYVEATITIDNVLGLP